MKKLLIALVAGAFVLSACSSEEAPTTTVKVKKHHVKHGHKKSASSAAKCK